MEKFSGPLVLPVSSARLAAASIMTSTFGKIRSLLATARIANVPSVVSNVWVGIAIWTICYDYHLYGPAPAIRWTASLLLTLAGICLYISGNFLNDWYDHEWDLKNRPERALPQGIFSRSTYLTTAIALALAGIGLAGAVQWTGGVVALAITALIVIYTGSHKVSKWSIIPMGLCRASLVYLGAFGMHDFDPRVPNEVFVILTGCGGLGLFCYIAGLSLSARYESMSAPPRSAWMISRALLFLPALLPLILSIRDWWLLAIGVIPFLLWLTLCHKIYRKPIPRYVSALLAGIPLVDWIFLLPLALSGSIWGRIHFTSFGLMCLLIPPLAFIAGRLLQRLAPAT
jgi:4-hydroxybenzoate polyprenyltransferase